MHPSMRQLATVCVLVFVSAATNNVAIAQLGMGPGPGGYGGFGAYGGNYGAFGSNAGGFWGGPYNTAYPSYGFGSPGYGLGYAGFGSGVGNFGYGFGNGYSYAQPLYSSYNMPNYSLYSLPLYSTRAYTPQVYTLRTFPPVGSSSAAYPGGGYSGSTPSMLNRFSEPSASAPTVLNVPRSLPQNAASNFDQGEILIFSPPTNNREISYTLNGAPYTMKPGTLQRFRNDRNWVIEVNLAGAGDSRYSLATGNYKFKETDTGMHLYTTKENPETPSAPTPEAPPALDPVPSVPAPAPGE